MLRMIWACVAVGLMLGSAVAARAEEDVNSLTKAEQDAGWKLLFDGKSTKGWRGYNLKEMPPGWAVKDGILARVKGGAGGKGAGGGDDIITVEEYDNFELKLQWRIVAGGNSGLLYRVKEGAVTSWHIAPEVQILDNTKWTTRDKRQLAGACYDLYAPAKDVTKPVGQWNEVHLIADGPKVEHRLNGEKLCAYEVGGDEWNKLVAASKFKGMKDFAKATKGYICLQDHSDKIEFRGIKLRPITK